MPWKECHSMDEKLRFVSRFADGEKIAALCREFGTSLRRHLSCAAHCIVSVYLNLVRLKCSSINWRHSIIPASLTSTILVPRQSSLICRTSIWHCRKRSG